MAPNDSAETTGEATSTVVGRRKAARYIVPVAVAGVAAATIGLVPALASSGDPDLPEISAQQLIEKIAASDEEQLSGTFKISTDLGLPLDGTVADLAAGSRGRLAVTTPDPGDAARILAEHGLTGLSADGDRLTADAPPADVDLADLNAALVSGGVRVRFFGVERGSLEDAFVALTGEGFDVAG
ncbi:hypothetical protein SGRI78S_04327 [Streptomyces griseus subsp. griseus]